MKIVEKTACVLSLSILLFAAANVAQARGGMSHPAYNSPAKAFPGSNLSTVYGKLPSGTMKQAPPTGIAKLPPVYSKFPPGAFKPVGFPTGPKLPPVWSKFPPGSFKPIAFGPIKTPPTKTPPTTNHPTNGWGYGGGFGGFASGLGGFGGAFGGGSGGNSGSDDTVSDDSVASPAVANVVSADDQTATPDSDQQVNNATGTTNTATMTQPTAVPAGIAAAQ